MRARGTRAPLGGGSRERFSPVGLHFGKPATDPDALVRPHFPALVPDLLCKFPALLLFLVPLQGALPGQSGLPRLLGPQPLARGRPPRLGRHPRPALPALLRVHPLIRPVDVPDRRVELRGGALADRRQQAAAELLLLPQLGPLVAAVRGPLPLQGEVRPRGQPRVRGVEADARQDALDVEPEAVLRVVRRHGPAVQREARRVAVVVEGNGRRHGGVLPAPRQGDDELVVVRLARVVVPLARPARSLLGGVQLLVARVAENVLGLEVQDLGLHPLAPLAHQAAHQGAARGGRRRRGRERLRVTPLQHHGGALLFSFFEEEDTTAAKRRPEGIEQEEEEENLLEGEGVPNAVLSKADGLE
mmetsp:Transcript_5995/g.17981  ORF Transcript_5995/g.17981 Transcript_5995/m.17981 type:complete len:359 (+) Transcript_5995:549-1625(+)